MPSSPAARNDATVLGLALLLCAALYPGAVLGGGMFFERDLNFDWYLRLEAVARALREGALPLWDPGVGFGQPLLADPGTQVLYPTTWLGLVLPRRVGYTAFVVVHLAFAALGAARLARALGAGALGAACSALVWVASGPLQSTVNLRQHLAGAAWMPWALLAAERAARAPSPRSALVLGLVLAAQVLAGSADASALTWTLAGAWTVFRAWPLRWRRGPARRPRGAAWLGLAAAALLAIGLTSVVWWPAADVLSRSTRRDLTADVRATWAVPASGLVRLAAPLDPARVPPVEATRLALYDRPDYPFFFSIYLGLVPLALGGLGLVDRRRRRTAAFFAATFVVATLVALGPHGPLYDLLANVLPPLRILRYPSKATLVVALAAALAAGFGASAIARGRLGRRALVLAAAALVLGTALVWLGVARLGSVQPAALPVAAGLAAAALAAAGAARLGGKLLASALATFAALELVSAHADLHATAPESAMFSPPPLAELVDKSGARRFYAYDYLLLPGRAESLLGRGHPFETIPPPRGWEPRHFAFAARQLYLPPPAAALLGIPGSYDADMRALYPRDLNDITFFVRQLDGTPALARLLSMGGVATVASLHTAGLQGLTPKATLQSLFPEPIHVWSVPGEPRRAWLAGCVRHANAAAAFQALVAPDFDPAREAIVAEPPAGLPACPAEADSPGDTRIASFTSDRVGFEVNALRPSLLVLADAWDPGWRASVDGRPAAVVRANVAFRGVAVPPGRHEVEMVYRPRAAALGLAASLACAIVCAALVAHARRSASARRAG